MPRMDGYGYALMRKIRQLLQASPAGQFRAIALTAYTGKVDQIVKIVARLCGPNGKTSA